MKKAIWVLIAALLFTAVPSCSESAGTTVTAGTAQPETSRPVSPSAPAAAVTEIQDTAAQVGQNIKIDADGLNVRRDADAGSEALGMAPRGGVYSVLDEKTDEEGRLWYRIQTDGGPRGWVAAWLCRQTEEKTNLELVDSLLDLYGDEIQTEMEGSFLEVCVSVGGFELDGQSELPDKLFYDVEDNRDKKELLSAGTEWSCVSENGKRLFHVRCSIWFGMLEYFWAQFPEYVSTYGSQRLNDLARIDISAQAQDGELKVTNVSCQMKYDNPELLKIEPVSLVEEGLKNGPSIGMTLQEAYQCLGGSFEDLEERKSGTVELGGVSLANVELYALPGDEVVWISVESGEYATTRGMKIGDTAETVERLYGKPDTGFSGDGRVIYQVVRTSQDGEPEFCDNDTMEVCYKNGRVSAFSFIRIYLD
ncbi:SH3 domain-containing protein [Papillibacter cinnamivorans]|uniref:SH3 domain-containing protein n=1 Tax=Papillibacter cinnamivorans DSM 12816 TaxID=1122930 RepID=A0A1W2B7G0_9FIRM|nr:SH3 domain-containing protein [Papillibacter cinnamivorans]SMC68730.1 SH3 domain-containing protein [Papillibacter cinnamivorans DSM 12816]